MGRPADAAPALRAPDVRLRPPRLFALGRRVRRRALRDRSSGRDRAAAALVGAGRHRWRELVEPHRLAFVAATLERLVEQLEAISGRRLDRTALRERLERVNRQEEIFDEARRLIASAPDDAGANDGADHQRHGDTMGSRLGLGARARGAFPRRGARRVDAGVAAYADERRRLMWVGSRTLARHRLLYGLRGVARRRLRLVDVSRFRSRRLHPLRLRRSDRGAREPHRELQRVPP